MKRYKVIVTLMDSSTSGMVFNNIENWSETNLCLTLIRDGSTRVYINFANVYTIEIVEE